MPSLSTWLTSPLLPAGILVAGTIVSWLMRHEKLAVRFLPSRWPALKALHYGLPVITVLAAVAALWRLSGAISPSHSLLVFPPALNANLTLRLRLDAWGRLFGLSLLWPTLLLAWLAMADSLAGSKVPDDPPVWPQWFLLLAAAHVALTAADWLTLTAALTTFDLVYLAVSTSREGDRWTFAANSLGGVAILIAAFILPLNGHSLTLTGDGPLPRVSTLLFVGAALIRLAPYPFHFWLSDPSESPSPTWPWLIRLSSSVLGLYLLARITPLLGGAMPGARWALIAGLGGCLAVAFLAWLTVWYDSQQAIPLIGLYQINLMLVGWALLGQRLTSLWTVLSFVLGTTSLAVHQAWLRDGEGEPLAWRDAIPGTVAVAALAGLPLTVGLFVRLPLYAALLTSRLAGGLALLLIADSLFSATVLHTWGGLGQGRFLWQPSDAQRSWSAWGATALLVAPLLILGVFPSLAARLAGLPVGSDRPLAVPIWEHLAQAGIGLAASLLLPLVMGYGIYRSGWNWPTDMIDLRAQLVSLLHLGWVHRVLDKLLGQVRQALWSVGAVLHGEGYLAWMALSLLLISLLVLSRF